MLNRREVIAGTAAMALIPAADHVDAELYRLEGERQEILAQWPDDCDDATSDRYGDMHFDCVAKMLNVQAQTKGGMALKLSVAIEDGLDPSLGVTGDVLRSMAADLGLTV